MSEALHFVLDPLLVANRVATSIWTRPCYSCISNSNNYLHSQYNLVNEFLQETEVIVQLGTSKKELPIMYSLVIIFL